MIYRDLILRPEPWQRLTAAFVRGRLAHAYLFSGPPGSGKEAHAIELAALVNCQALRPPPMAGLRQAQDGALRQAQDGACGRCPSCRKVQILQHPNIQIVVPLPRRSDIDAGDPPLKALKPADLESLTDQLAAKATDPYATIHLDGATTILINSVRELRRTAYLKPAEVGWRVVLIFQAELLAVPNHAAANALLKLLEEPPAETIFVLVTHRPHLLLDTIRSRCLGLYFPPHTAEQVASYLARHHQLPDEDARILAQASGGSITRARALAEEVASEQSSVISSDAGEKNTRTVDIYAGLDPLLEALLARRPTGWQQLVSDLSQQHRRQPLAFATRMQLLTLWLRDLMVLPDADAGALRPPPMAGLRQAQDKPSLVFAGRREELKGHHDAYPQADWGAAAAAVEEAQHLLERNIQPSLVLTNMILDVRAAIKGEPLVISR